MSWRDVLMQVPRSPHNPHNPQSSRSAEGCEGIGDCGKRVPGVSTKVVSLRRQVRQARDWVDLYAILDTAQGAYDAGEVTREEAESLSGYAEDRSRHLPEQPGGRDDYLSELLARHPIVRVRSRLLGEVVVWVADSVEEPEKRDEVVYRESELRRLAGRQPQKVRSIHAAKRTLDGVLEDANDTCQE
jgi:hypothetical protein